MTRRVIIRARGKQDMASVNGMPVLTRVPNLSSRGVLYQCPGSDLPVKIFATTVDGEGMTPQFFAYDLRRSKWNVPTTSLLGQRDGFEKNLAVREVGIRALHEFGLLEQQGGCAYDGK